MWLQLRLVAAEGGGKKGGGGGGEGMTAVVLALRKQKKKANMKTYRGGWREEKTPMLKTIYYRES